MTTISGKDLHAKQTKEEVLVEKAGVEATLTIPALTIHYPPQRVDLWSESATNADDVAYELVRAIEQWGLMGALDEWYMHEEVINAIIDSDWNLTVRDAVVEEKG